MNSRDSLTRLFWESMCIRNGHSWILYRDVWHSYWTNTSSSVNILFDPQNRGFLLYVDSPDSSDSSDDVTLYFALVDIEHRHKGVLSSLMGQLSKKFPSRKVILTVVVGVSPMHIWEHYGFTPTTLRYAEGDHITLTKQL